MNSPYVNPILDQCCIYIYPGQKSILGRCGYSLISFVRQVQGYSCPVLLDNESMKTLTLIQHENINNILTFENQLNRHGNDLNKYQNLLEISLLEISSWNDFDFLWKRWISQCSISKFYPCKDWYNSLEFFQQKHIHARALELHNNIGLFKKIQKPITLEFDLCKDAVTSTYVVRQLPFKCDILLKDNIDLWYDNAKLRWKSSRWDMLSKIQKDGKSLMNFQTYTPSNGNENVENDSTNDTNHKIGILGWKIEGDIQVPRWMAFEQVVFLWLEDYRNHPTIYNNHTHKGYWILFPESENGTYTMYRFFPPNSHCPNLNASIYPEWSLLFNRVWSYTFNYVIVETPEMGHEMIRKTISQFTEKWAAIGEKN